MSPASHSGLIYYSETLKHLVRREKILSFLPRKKKALQNVTWEQDRKANGTTQGGSHRARWFCTQCTFTRPEGPMESLQVSVTHARATVRASQNWGAGRTPSTHPLLSHFIESPEKTHTKTRRSFVAAQFKCTSPDSQPLCHSQRMRDPFPWKAQEESTDDLFFPPRPMRGFSSKSQALIASASLSPTRIHFYS